MSSAGFSGPLPDHILKLMDKKDRPPGVAGMTKEEVYDKNEKKSEKEIQGQIGDYLRLKEIAFCNPRMDTKSGIGIGWPDFTLCFNGVAIGLEVKTARGKATQEQEAVHIKMRKNGWAVHLVRSVQEVKIILDSICEKNP